MNVKILIKNIVRNFGNKPKNSGDWLTCGALRMTAVKTKQAKAFNDYVLSGPTWLRLTVIYWIVLVNVGLSYLFVHILSKI